MPDPEPTLNPMRFDVKTKLNDPRPILLPPCHDVDENGERLGGDYAWQRGKWYPIELDAETSKRLPAKFGLVVRPSSTFPERQKALLIGPVDVELGDERIVFSMVADEWRMETN